MSGASLSAPPQHWLGLDVGTRRIGVALSNALAIAQPLLTIERSRPRDDQRSVLRLARRYECAGVVIGNPLQLSGDASRQTERVHRFADTLQALIAETIAAGKPTLEVHLWDERLSTVAAHAALGHDADRRSGHSRGIIDQLAAAIILQGWLDARRNVVTLLPPDP